MITKKYTKLKNSHMKNYKKVIKTKFGCNPAIYIYIGIYTSAISKTKGGDMLSSVAKVYIKKVRNS